MLRAYLHILKSLLEKIMNKVVVITGTSKGIGKAMALYYLK